MRAEPSLQRPRVFVWSASCEKYKVIAFLVVYHRLDCCAIDHSKRTKSMFLRYVLFGEEVLFGRPRFPVWHINRLYLTWLVTAIR